MKTKCDLINLSSGEVIKINKDKIDDLLKNRLIYYHHNYRMYCYKGKNDKKVGDIVYHPFFKVGKVIRVHNKKVDVDFKEGKEKTLIASISRLKKNKFD
jgi:hypothetical protein